MSTKRKQSLGTTGMNSEELETILERAALKGAKQALHEVGLHDDEAGYDVKELRSLLDAWRSAKKTVVNTFLTIITTTVLAILAGGVWLDFNKK